MNRLLHTITLFATLGGAGVLCIGEAQGGKSEEKVRVIATATKIDATGKQTVTITLEIDKGIAVYANPVNLTWGGKPEPDFDSDRTHVTIRAKEKVTTTVKYPKGKVFTTKFLKDVVQYEYYDGRVQLEAVVQRVAGDVSPLEVAIHFR